MPASLFAPNGSAEPRPVPTSRPPQSDNSLAVEPIDVDTQFEPEMASLFLQLLPDKSPEHVEKLCTKLSAQGLTNGEELLVLGEEAMLKKLETHAGLTSVEISNVQEIVRKLRSQKRRRSNGGGHQPGGRCRSRSPKGREERHRQGNKTPALFGAVERGDIRGVQRILRQNGAFDLEERCRGLTPLMKASEEGVAPIVRTLLQQRASLESTTRSGRVALDFAVCPSGNREASLDILKLLLEAGADAKHADEAGQTPRDRALERYGTGAVVLAVLDAEHQSKAPNPQEGKAPRQRSGSKGQSKGQSKGPNGKGQRAPALPKPALWEAVERGDTEAVQALFLNGGGVDIEEKHQGWTALMKASEEGHTDNIRLLLEQGASLEASNRNGRAALSMACCPSGDRETSLEAVRLLLEAGADPNRADERGATPRSRALEKFGIDSDVVAALDEWGK